MRTLCFSVPDAWDQKKLNDFLRLEIGLSGTVIKNAKRIENGITMNEEHIRTVDFIRAGAVIRVKTDEAEREYVKGAVAATVLYCDDDIMVLDKIAKMPCHPSKGHPCDTLANAFAATRQAQGEPFRPIGRLDADTSGAVLCARHAHMAYILSNHKKCSKTYLAIVSPPPKCDEGTVDAPIYDDRESIGRRIDLRGQRAVTHYKILLKNEKLALAALKIETGRTHQIRLHMAHIGSPLIGDALYGGDISLISRHALHCRSLRVVNPLTDREIHVVSPLPQDMLLVLQGFFADEKINAALLAADAL